MSRCPKRPKASDAATIEPVVAASLAFGLFGQRLTTLGAVGLVLVVGGVAGGYLEEAQLAARDA